MHRRHRLAAQVSRATSDADALGARALTVGVAFAIPTRESGTHAFAAHVIPWNALLGETRATSLVRWARSR